MHTIFEVHRHENQKLPFYFHKNMIRSSNSTDIYRWHPALEICLCTSGNGHMLCNSVSYPFQEGELFIVNSNALHNSVSDVYMVFDCLIIDESFFDEVDIDLKNLHFQQLIKDKEARQYFNRVGESFLAQEAYRIARVRSHVLNLLIYLCDHYAQPVAAYTGSASATVETAKIAIGYINAHLTERLTLDMLARETGLNKYYLCHEFKKITNHTVFSYINISRCEKAAGLLLKQENTIQEVCRACGFENASYFTRTFEKYYGVSPSVYRKQHI